MTPSSLLHRVRNIWRPQNFHLHHRLGRPAGHFEGWYFKLVDPAGEQPCAIIPGVFLGEDPHAFVQILDGRTCHAAYHRFPVESFRAARDVFDVRIANNRFGTEGISLDIDSGSTSAGQRVKGEIRFGRWRAWPVTLTSPGVMGPYGFIPTMECNHGILSLDHTLEGGLSIDQRETRFDGGRGYVEKDWGRRFPSGYVWTQSNHFEQPGTSLTASVAVIPWLTSSFRGFLIGFLHDGELHRFTTYAGGAIESLEMTDSHLHLCARNRHHRLEIEARKAAGAVLHAPYDRVMIERVAETMTSEIELRLSALEGGAPVYEGRGHHACLEAHGDLEAVLDG